MSKENTENNYGCILIVLAIIGFAIYNNYFRLSDKTNTEAEIEVNDSISNENTNEKIIDHKEIDELLKHSTRLGSAGPDLTTDEGVNSAINSAIEYNISNPDFDYDKAVSTINEDSRKAKFCKKYTDNARNYHNMEKSYFVHDRDVIIQKMYISDIAGGYGKKYRLIAKEATENGYIEVMSSEMVNEYKKNGVFDEFDNQGFTEFQLYLILENGEQIISEKHSIY